MVIKNLPKIVFHWTAQVKLGFAVRTTPQISMTNPARVNIRCWSEQ